MPANSLRNMMLIPTQLCTYALCYCALCHIKHTTTNSYVRNYKLFLQNKANFRKSQMNVTNLLTSDYEKKDTWWRGKNEPKTNPNEPNSKKTKINVTSILTVGYENKSPIRAPKKRTQISKRQNPIQTFLPKRIMKETRFWVRTKQTQFKPKQTQSLAKNSCARLWALLQCFSENFDKPGVRKAECSARPKLRTNPMNLLGTMPAKGGKIDLKHSFCRSAFCFMVDVFINNKLQK